MIPTLDPCKLVTRREASDLAEVNPDLARAWARRGFVSPWTSRHGKTDRLSGYNARDVIGLRIFARLRELDVIPSVAAQAVRHVQQVEDLNTLTGAVVIRRKSDGRTSEFTTDPTASLSSVSEAEKLMVFDLRRHVLFTFTDEDGARIADTFRPQTQE